MVRRQCQSLLGTTKTVLGECDSAGPLYARVLGMGRAGRGLLRQIQDSSTIPVVTRLTQHLTERDLRNPECLTPLQRMLSIDIRAGNIYSLGAPGRHHRSGGTDFLTSPFYFPEQQI